MYTQILPKLPTNFKSFKAVAGKANWYLVGIRSGKAMMWCSSISKIAICQLFYSIFLKLK